MYDAACPSEAATETPQRARGELRIGFGLRDGATALRDLYQSGCLKARFPRPERGGAPVAVLLNTAGGIAGGDRLRTAIHVAAGARLTVTTQAAERLYRARPADLPAAIETSLHLEDAALLDWLPQETILFDRAAARRRLTIDLAASATFTGVETLVLGRRAMGETVDRASWHDLIRLRRDGRLLLHDAVRLDGAAATHLAGPATAGGAGAVATLIHAGPEAEGLLDPLRACLAGHDAGASAWDGLLVARILAADSARLRPPVMAGLAVLRPGRALPRIWHT